VTPLNLIFSGSGEFGLPTLRAILAAGHRVVQVISQPDRPAGRGKKLTPTPIAQFALQQQLPLIRTADINRESLPPADVMLVIAFGQKIAPHVVDHPRLGSVNLHASLLPQYRGAAPINWAIIRGETVTGNSVIRLAEKMDAGAILGQSRLPIGDLETAGELHDRLAEDGGPLMLDVLQKMVDGALVQVEQDHARATLAPKLDRDSARIDWNRPAPQIALQIRGMYPWPGCHTKIIDIDGQDRGRLTLVRARPGGKVHGAPGAIDLTLHVAAADGTGVEIVQVQPEGKCPMPLTAYRNGHPWLAGMRLESV
jgi:methionyl-tRNA formyltransferase